MSKGNFAVYVPCRWLLILQHNLEYLRVVLDYFKYVEMNNLFVAIKDPYRGWDINAVKERFQLYRDPLLESLRDRVDGAQTRVDMYG